MAVIYVLVVVPGFPMALRLMVGRSMLPTYTVAEACLMARPWVHDYGVGDVVIYPGGHLGEDKDVGHRIVAMSGDVVVTRGDNNDFTEEVGHGDIKYVVVAHAPIYILGMVVLLFCELSVIGMVAFFRTFRCPGL